MNEEWLRIKNEYQQALHNFEQAQGAYIDAAIADLDAAEKRMRAYLKELKSA